MTDLASQQDDFQSVSDARKLVVIQRNPTSGSGKGRKQLHDLIRFLRSDGFRVRLFASRERLDRFLKDDKEQQQLRCIVAAGGDGTIASVLNRHPETPIATLPLGTENLVARHLGIERDARQVAKVVRVARYRWFDTGLVNQQQFLIMASVGVDADVVHRLDATRAGHIHHLSYLQPIIRCFFGYSYPTLCLHGNAGKVLAEGTHIVVTNMPEYGFRMPFAPNASPLDGLFDVRVFRRQGVIATTMHAIRTRIGFADRVSEVDRFQVASCRITSQSTAPAQCDGDPAGFCPLEITIQPQSLALLVDQ